MNALAVMLQEIELEYALHIRAIEIRRIHLFLNGEYGLEPGEDINWTLLAEMDIDDLCQIIGNK